MSMKELWIRADALPVVFEMADHLKLPETAARIHDAFLAANEDDEMVTLSIEDELGDLVNKSSDFFICGEVREKQAVA
jgi:hypothetical protein